MQFHLKESSKYHGQFDGWLEVSFIPDIGGYHWHCNMNRYRTSDLDFQLNGEPLNIVGDYFDVLQVLLRSAMRDIDSKDVHDREWLYNRLKHGGMDEQLKKLGDFASNDKPRCLKCDETPYYCKCEG